MEKRPTRVKVEAWTVKKHVPNEEFIYFPTILDYKKENLEIHTAVFLSFASVPAEEFGTRFHIHEINASKIRLFNWHIIFFAPKGRFR